MLIGTQITTPFAKRAAVQARLKAAPTAGAATITASGNRRRR
jgi:hypothetical protein